MSRTPGRRVNVYKKYKEGCGAFALHLNLGKGSETLQMNSSTSKRHTPKGALLDTLSFVNKFQTLSKENNLSVTALYFYVFYLGCHIFLIVLVVK